MPEKLSTKRNEQTDGDSDFLSSLEDLTLLDVATNPDYSEKDQKNAQATIAERQKNGVYDDSGEQRVSTEDDLFENGFGVLDGKIYAPASELPDQIDPNEKYRDMGAKVLGLSSDEDLDSLPKYSSIPKKELPNRQDRSEMNPNEAHKREMRRSEENKSKLDEFEDTTDAYENYLKDNNPGKIFQGKTHETYARKHISPEEVQNNIDAKKEGLTDVSPERRMEKALDYAKFKLSKENAVQQMYAEGALDGISEGDFSLNPGFIYDGLKSLHGREIDRRAGGNRDTVWESIRYDGMLPKVESVEQLKDLERNAIETSIELGVLEDEEGRLGEKSFKMALPIEKLGEERMAKLLSKYDVVIDNSQGGVDPETGRLTGHSLELYEKFESGFVNIIDHLKDDTDSQAGFKELNWYYERLLMGAPDDEITDNVINQYEAGESEAFVKKFDQFMAWRANIIKEAQEDSPGEPLDDVDETDIEILNHIQESDEALPAELTLSDLMEKLKEGSLNDELIFPVLDLGTTRMPRERPIGAKKNPEDYGKRKLITILDEMKSVYENLDGFEAGEPYMAISTPYYMHYFWKEVTRPDGIKGKVVDRVKSRELVPAHWDKELESYVSDRTGNPIDSQNIRQYISFYFSINDINVSIKESITNMSSALYIIVGEDASGPNLATFHGSIKDAKFAIDRNPNSILKKFPHRGNTIQKRMLDFILKNTSVKSA